MPKNIEACEWLTNALQGLEVPSLDSSFSNMRAVCPLAYSFSSFSFCFLFVIVLQNVKFADKVNVGMHALNYCVNKSFELL